MSNESGAEIETGWATISFTEEETTPWKVAKTLLLSSFFHCSSQEGKELHHSSQLMGSPAPV